jgi:hypothetical protein
VNHPSCVRHVKNGLRGEEFEQIRPRHRYVRQVRVEESELSPSARTIGSIQTLIDAPPTMKASDACVARRRKDLPDPEQRAHLEVSACASAENALDGLSLPEEDEW